MRTVKIQLAFTLLILAFFLFSCADDTTTNTRNGNNSGKTLIVKVVDNNGMTANNVFVSINSGAGFLVNSDGTKTFSNVTVPYDLMLISARDTNFTIYKGLTSLSPVVNAFGIYDNGSPLHQATILVNYPGVSHYPYSRALLKFVSQTNVQTINEEGNDSTSLVFLRWDGPSEISGTFCAMIDSGNSGQPGFLGIALKDTLFVSGSSNLFRFNVNDFSFNPSEAYLNLNLFSGINIYNYESYVSFNGNSMNSNINFDDGGANATSVLTLIVPGTMPIPYKIKVSLSLSTQTGEAYNFIAYMNPGDNIQVPQPVYPELLNPPDHAVGIDSYSQFSYNATGGVYLASFNLSTYNNFGLTVISVSNSFQLPDLSLWGYRFRGNKLIHWHVSNYLGYSGVDEFASSKRFTNDPRFTGISNSEIRSFTTAP
jgi:hypothetical protein